MSREGVVVVVVVRRHADRLDAVLSAVGADVDARNIVVANLSGDDITTAIPARIIDFTPTETLSNAVTASLEHLGGDAVWIVRDDTLPRAGALDSLHAVLLTSPSVGVVGPKQINGNRRGEIREMGESLSRSGFAIQLAERELDQGQYDRHSDVFGVGEAGMLVRREVWESLQGFDPALDVVDGALDFCFRARGAGWRVEIVPSAVIESGDSSLESRRGEVSPASVIREESRARAHRILSRTPVLLAPLRAIALMIGAFVRGIGRLARKKSFAFAELTGIVTGSLRPSAIALSRASIARTTTQPVERSKLFVSRSEMLRRGALERDAERAAREAVDSEPRLAFGQLAWWMTGAALVVGLVLGYQLLGAGALAGGGLLPVSDSIRDVWSIVGSTHTPLTGGMSTAPDGFGALLAGLSTLTWWDPNLAFVGLWLLAVPMTFIAAWVGAGAFTVRAGAAFVIAAGWTLLPSLHLALAEGRIGSVLAHIALPLATRALLSRGAVSAGWFALLAATVWVSVPALAPLIVIATLARAISGRPAVLLALIPALALEWRRIVEAASVQPLTYFADRGVPVTQGSAPVDAWLLWPTVPSIPFVDDSTAMIAITALVAVIVAGTLAVIAGGAARIAATVSIGALGVVVWVLLDGLPLAHIATTTVSVSPGALLDPLWFGLLAGIAVAGARFRTVRPVAAPLTVLALSAASLSAIVLPLTGGSLVQTSPVRTVPAFVEAETRSNPAAGTLVITPVEDAIVVELQRGRGATLTEWTATAATRRVISETESLAATLAGNLVAESGFDALGTANELDVRFVLLRAQPTHPFVSAISSHDGLDAVGQTSTGVLWTVGIDERYPAPASTRDWTYLGIAGTALAVAVVAAIPTTLPRRRQADDETISGEEEPDA